LIEGRTTDEGKMSVAPLINAATEGFAQSEKRIFSPAGIRRFSDPRVGRRAADFVRRTPDQICQS